MWLLFAEKMNFLILNAWVREICPSLENHRPSPGSGAFHQASRSKAGQLCRGGWDASPGVRARQPGQKTPGLLCNVLALSSLTSPKHLQQFLAPSGHSLNIWWMNDGLIQINQYHIVYTCYTTWNALPPGLVNLAPICQSDGNSMAPSSERPTLSPQAHSLITLLYLSHPLLLAYITSPHWQIQERLYGFVLISSEKGCLFFFLFCTMTLTRPCLRFWTWFRIWFWVSQRLPKKRSYGEWITICTQRRTGTSFFFLINNNKAMLCVTSSIM